MRFFGNFSSIFMLRCTNMQKRTRLLSCLHVPQVKAGTRLLNSISNAGKNALFGLDCRPVKRGFLSVPVIRDDAIGRYYND